MTLYELVEVMGEVDGVSDKKYDWTMDAYYEFTEITKKNKEDIFFRGFCHIVYKEIVLEKRHNGVVVGNFTEWVEKNWNKLEKPIEEHFNIDLEDREQAICDFMYYVMNNLLYGEYSNNLYKDFINALCGTNYE